MRPTITRPHSSFTVRGALGIAVCALLVAACGDDDGDNDTDADSDPMDATSVAEDPDGTATASDGTSLTETTVADEPASNDDDSDGATRTIESSRGPVDVPAAPERIVALDPYVSLQVLDELGAPLVAAGSLGADTRAFVSDEADALPSVGQGTELSYEAIAAAEPDVIVGLETYGTEIDLLDQIAPTVLIPRDNWQDNILAVADVVDERDGVERSLAGLDQRVDELGAEIEAAWSDGLSMSLLRVPSDSDVRNYTTFFDNLMASEVLGRLPVMVTGDAQAASEEDSYVEVAAESLEQVDADVILYYFGGGVLTTGEQDAARSNLLDNPLWSLVEANEAGRAHEVDAELWFTGANLRAADLLLDDIERYLAAGGE